MQSEIRERLAFFFGMMTACGLIFTAGLLLELMSLGNHIFVSVFLFALTVSYLVQSAKKLFRIKYVEVKR